MDPSPAPLPSEHNKTPGQGFHSNRNSLKGRKGERGRKRERRTTGKNSCNLLLSGGAAKTPKAGAIVPLPLPEPFVCAEDRQGVDGVCGTDGQ